MTTAPNLPLHAADNCPIQKAIAGGDMHDIFAAIDTYALAAYQAGRGAGLEEAAAVCESRIGECEPGLEDAIQDIDNEARLCADAIRAFKSPAKEPL